MNNEFCKNATVFNELKNCDGAIEGTENYKENI